MRSTSSGQKRLGDVVVGPERQAAHPVEGLVFRGEEHHGRAGVRRMLADARKQAEAVQVRHHHVEDEQLVGAFGGSRARFDGRERLRSGVHGIHLGKPRAMQDGRHHVGQLRLVIHQKDALISHLFLHHAEPACLHPNLHPPLSRFVALWHIPRPARPLPPRT